MENTHTDPQTANEFLEEGITQEEYADRWLLSDLAKSLRAYQVAVTMYERAMLLDRTLTDAVYNRLRLLFHVYETYKDVPRSVLSGCESCYVHLLGLEGLVNEYDKAGWVNWECACNHVLILMEVVEQEGVTFEVVMQRTQKNMHLTGRILEVQMRELDLFLKRLEGGETDEGAQEEGEGEMYEQIVPSTVLDTLTTSWRFIYTILEDCDTVEEINRIQQGTHLFRNELDKSFALIQRFTPGNTDPFNINVKQEELIELSLVQLCIQSMYTVDVEVVNSIWAGYQDESSARWLAQSDIFTNLLSLAPFSDNDKWNIISLTLKSLKSAQDVLTGELQVQMSLKSALVSKIVSKIVEVLISRADNELLRASLDCDTARQHCETLKVNAINLLKNGLNQSQGNVGLRESALDKLQRAKFKRECVVRLLILTRETIAVDDLKRNLGDLWEQEWTEMKRHSLYSNFPIVSTV